MLPLLSLWDLDDASRRVLPPRKNVWQVRATTGELLFEMADDAARAACTAGYMFQGDMSRDMILTLKGTRAFDVYCDEHKLMTETHVKRY